ncbi:hypothetical protein [Aeromonas hydrophila]|uniref:hypothetical protein n=1 Tax=Aeromonas hydrophila TaxID=644 RepID=UPI002B470B2E|nr:hypothetical protein [Aeromonas hydrophila]
MITFNEKTQSVTLCGQVFTLEYFQRVQAPLLIEALGWSVPTLVNWMESAEIPLGQFARAPKVQNFLIEREEERQKAAKEQAERERLAHYNSPEQVAKRKRDAEALHQARLNAARAARGNGRKPLAGSGAETIIACLLD